MDELWYLALAYGVIWIGLLSYLAYVSRQALSVREELRVFRDVVASEAEENEPGWEDESVEESAEALSDTERVRRGGRAGSGET